MGYSQIGISNYYDDVRAQFKSTGSGYTFFTSESPDLTNIRINSTTEGSTTLVYRVGDSLKSTPINSSVHSGGAKFYHVQDPSMYKVNMFISAMVDEQKSDQAVHYSDGAICCSSNGGTLDYTPGTLLDCGAYYGERNQDIGWGTRPTAYFKSSPGTTLANKQSQILFPRIPSPRWFRRAAIQPVTTSDNTIIYFFILTDVLSRFYIYPAHLSKIAEKDSDIIQRDGTSDWVILNKYQVHDVDFGDAIAPKINDFHGTESPQHKYYDKYNDSLEVFYGDYSKGISAKDTDEEFDSFMGVEEPYKDKYNLTPYQYLWRFNYNGTKATTIAFQKGDAIKVKNIKGETSELCKHKGGSFSFPEDYKNAFGGILDGSESAIEPAPKLKEVPIDKVYEYYPVLLEVELKIEATNSSFSSSVITTVSKSAKSTKEWYVASGYTHPYLDPQTNKYVSGDIPEEKISETETVGGYTANDLIYLTLNCYGDTVNYEDKEKPYDVCFESLKDSKYKEDIPSILKEGDNKHLLDFLEMLISGKYDKKIIEAVIDKVTGAKDFKAYVAKTVSEKYKKHPANEQYYDFFNGRYINFTTSKVYTLNDVTLNYKFYETLSASSRLRKLLAFFIKQATIRQLVEEPQDIDTEVYSVASAWAYQEVPDSDTGKPNTGKQAKYVGSTIYDETVAKDLVNLLKAGKRDSRSSVLRAIDDVFSFIFYILDLSFRTHINPLLTYNYHLRIQNICFMKLLRDYLSNYQVFDLYLQTNEVILNMMFGWCILDYALSKSNFGTAAKDFIKEIVAQGFFLKKDDMVFQKTSDSDISYKDSFFQKLPVPCCQIIDGMLIPNSAMFRFPPRDAPQKDAQGNDNFKTSLGKGNASKPDYKTPRAYHIATLPDLKRDLYLLQELSPLMFGRKIHKFQATLALKNRQGATIKEFLLIDTPYVAVQPTPYNVATFPILPFNKGDEKPFSARALLWNRYIFKSAFTELKDFFPKGYGRPLYERFAGSVITSQVRDIVATDPTQSSSIESRQITITPPPDPTQPLPAPTPNSYTVTIEWHTKYSNTGYYGVASNGGPGTYFVEIHTRVTNLPDGSISTEVLRVKIPTEYTVFSSSLYRMPGDGSSSNKTHTNGVVFGLFIKTDKTTRTYNLSASDLYSRSFIFHGSTSNYHYQNDYKVGTYLYINGNSYKANGECKAPHDFELNTNSKKLDTAQFNMIYSLIATSNLIDDIPQNQSLYSSGNLLYNNKPEDNSKISKDQLEPDNYHVLPNESIKVIRSTISSHPNGSVAAYSLPPYGFLKTIYTDPSKPKTYLLGGYKPTFTIDVISAYKPPKDIKSKELRDRFPTFIVSTHKDQYNSAFTYNDNESKRDYVNYTTDPRTKEAMDSDEKNVYLGGFCTAGVWYDFKLPKDYPWVIPAT